MYPLTLPLIWTYQYFAMEADSESRPLSLWISRHLSTKALPTQIDDFSSANLCWIVWKYVQNRNHKLRDRSGLAVRYWLIITIWMSVVQYNKIISGARSVIDISTYNWSTNRNHYWILCCSWTIFILILKVSEIEDIVTWKLWNKPWQISLNMTQPRV